MQAITYRISQLRSYLKTLIMVHGLGSLVLTLCGIVVFTFVCDYLFHLPWRVRAVLLGLSVVAVGVVVYRRFLRPLNRTMLDDELALCIEAAYPKVDCRIISAVQLSRESQKADFPYSRSLVAQLVDDAEEVADTVDPTKSVNTAVIRKHLLTAGAVVALLIGINFVFLKHGEAGIWFNRFLLGSDKWPRKTELEIKIEPATKIVRGDEVTVRVTVKRGSPSDVLIYYKFDSGDRDRVSMVQESKGVFTYKFPQVLSRLKFDVYGGDDELLDNVVEIDIPPRIEDVQIFRKYPEYTKKPPTPQAKPETDGNIKDLKGTEITFVGRSNIDLKDGTLKMKTASAEQSFAMDLVQKTLVRTSFPVTENADYSIHITGKNKLDNKRDPIRYKIVVIPDRAPLVVLKKPGQNRQVLADTIVDLEIEVMDDYGIKDLQLRYQVTSRGESAKELVSVPIPFPGQNVRFGPHEAKARFAFDMAPLKLMEGDIVTYFIQASDYNNVTGPGIGESNRYQLKVVSRSTLEEQVERTLREVMLDLEGILKDQKKNLSDSMDYRDRVKIGGLTEAMLKRLPYLEFLQDQITQRSKNATDRLDRIVEDIRQFKLSQSVAVDKLESVARVVRGIGYDSPTGPGKSIRAYQNLTALRGKGVQPMPHLDQSIQAQEQIVKDLQEILQLLEVWHDLSSLIRMNRDLIKTTADVDRILQELLKEKPKK